MVKKLKKEKECNKVKKKKRGWKRGAVNAPLHTCIYFAKDENKRKNRQKEEIYSSNNN